MKTNVLLLYPYRFTKFEYYKYEISKLEKNNNLKVIINDLSDIISNKKLNAVWKTKLEEKTLKFSSLISWIFYFNKIKKKKTVIFNFLDSSNFKSFIIVLLIKLSKLPVLFYDEDDGAVVPKKNINFFLSRINEHKFNYKVYLYYLKHYLFSFLVNLVNYDKIILFSQNSKKKNYRGSTTYKEENFINVNINTFDFSNAISITKNNKKRTIKNSIVYLDNGGPYFTGDTYEKGNAFPKYDIEKWYNELNEFFDKVEKYFKAKIIVIPHPKYKSHNAKKIKSFNHYFNKRVVNNDYDSLAKISPSCSFFISQGSTAMSYAIIHYKPVIHIYSPNRIYGRTEIKHLKDQAKNTGKKIIDISQINKKKIIKNLSVNKRKYNLYRYKYLTPKNKALEKTPNYKIIGRTIINSIKLK